MISAPNRSTLSQQLDLGVIKFDAQQSLLKLLNKFEGTKTIVWDDKLIGPFEFVANASLLKEHDAIKLFRLSDPRITFTTDYVLYFLRKDYMVARMLVDSLQPVDKSLLGKISLVFVPQRCQSIEQMISHNKIDIDRLHSIEELNIEFFLLDSDIFSMENEFVYRDMYINDDFSAVHQIVEGLTKLEDAFGTIPKITGLGLGAKLVSELMLKERKLASQSKAGATGVRSGAGQINQLILIDRRTDLVTPLLTQLTYEGLLDEVFGINHGTVSLPKDKFLQPEEKEDKDSSSSSNSSINKKRNVADKELKKFELRSSEELYARLRDSHINAIGNIFKQSAKNLQAEYEECNSEGKTIHEMGKIVKRLNHLKVAKNSQSNHVNIAELLNEQTLKPEFIIGLRIEHDFLQEDRINRINPDLELKLMRQESVFHVLRLICLQSILNNGLKSKICDYYKKEILQNYGDRYLLLLMQIEKANLLLARERYHEFWSFAQLKSKFNLINDNVDDCNPNHLSYVYGGYAPISVITVKYLAQFLNATQWRSTSENLKLLNEPIITHSSPVAASTSSNNSGSLAAGELGGSLLSSSVVNSLLLSTSSYAPAALRTRKNSSTSSQSLNEDTRVVLVFFIGGCTFAEISAVRYLSQQEENNCEFIIGTTKIINGRTFLKSLWPNLSKQTAA